MVLSNEDSTAVRECAIYLDEGQKMTTTDSRGNFIFNDVSSGEHLVHVMSDDYAYQVLPVSIDDRNQSIRVFVLPREMVLGEVVVSDSQSEFGFTRMRPVENVGIYEGKKSEVIIPSQLVANLSTNNARQVYSRVAGLNIWENDGAGLQLSIGGRGLDPNRSSNFNVRQNGYDISADALGYPESYYTPPMEAIGKIQIVRGAASLQYGTQFGGLINFIMKKPVEDKPVELVARQTVGSFNFYNAFTSASGTVDKLGYYTFFQYKKGDGWRPNSAFDNHTFYAHVDYAATPKTKVGIDFTQMDYLAQQPGGLTDEMFAQDPRQSNRTRNWFKVNWNLAAVHVDHKFNETAEFNARVFGLSAYRYALGFRPNRVATIDDGSGRDLIKGRFENVGAEVRFLKRYAIGDVPSVVLIGARYFRGHNRSVQGEGSNGSDANFRYDAIDNLITYEYEFPNRNTSAFVEDIFFLGDRFSVTPGIRFERIHTAAEGFYGKEYRDLAGNIIEQTRTNERRENGRQFIIAGVGISYKPFNHVEAYSNLSQNYRSITFSDMRIANPSSVIDPGLKDERGYSFDAGIRSDQNVLVNYDVSYFLLDYRNRIGEVQFYDDMNRVMRLRTNLGRAVVQGLESYVEADLVRLMYPQVQRWSGAAFLNAAWLHSRYVDSGLPGITGNEVEFVPQVNIKGGFRVGFDDLLLSFQYSYLSRQYSDATNAGEGGASGVLGVIPAYGVMDASLSYQFKRFRIETSVNNVANRAYFTRRATGYPGPGILPSDGRSFYMTLQVKI